MSFVNKWFLIWRLEKIKNFKLYKIQVNPQIQRDWFAWLLTNSRRLFSASAVMLHRNQPPNSCCFNREIPSENYFQRKHQFLNVGDRQIESRILMNRFCLNWALLESTIFHSTTTMTKFSSLSQNRWILMGTVYWWASSGCQSVDGRRLQSLFSSFL